MSKAASIYVDRDGVQISMPEWSLLQTQDEYRFIRRYGNEKVKVNLMWLGMVPRRFVDNSLPDYWPVFELQVWNVGPDGQAIEDPVEHGRKFGRQGDAVEWYDAFIAKWTESYVDERGKLIEVGNEFAPPDPNSFTPASMSANVFAGSW